MTPLTPAERWAEHMGWHDAPEPQRVPPEFFDRLRSINPHDAACDVAADASTATPRRGDVSTGASPRPRPVAARPAASGARSTLTIITAAALFVVAALFAVIGCALATSPDSARAVVPLTLAAMFGYCVAVAIKGDE